MSSPNDPVLCCPLPYRVAPVFVQVVSPPLGWSPLSSFLVIWSPSGDARGPSVVFEAVNMPCPGPFHFSHSVDYIYEVCPLSDPDVGPSIFVCDVEHTSFHFGLCGRKFVLCLFGQCPGLCTIWLRPTKSGPVGLKKLTFHTFHHVQYNGCFKHMNYRLSMSNKPCHTIFFSFRMVGLQSWVLRVTKSSRFLRYPQDTSHFLCFYHVQINTYNLL